MTKARKIPGQKSSARIKDRLDLADEALAGCERIAVLGSLLAATRCDGVGEMPLEVVAQSGEMIAREAQGLQRLVNHLC